MAKTKAEKVRAHLQDRFSGKQAEAFAAQFDGLKLVTSYDLFTSRMVSVRDDGEELTGPQFHWLQGFEAAWLACAAEAWFGAL